MYSGQPQSNPQVSHDHPTGTSPGILWVPRTTPASHRHPVAPSPPYTLRILQRNPVSTLWAPYGMLRTSSSTLRAPQTPTRALEPLKGPPKYPMGTPPPYGHPLGTPQTPRNTSAASPKTPPEPPHIPPLQQGPPHPSPVPPVPPSNAPPCPSVPRPHHDPSGTARLRSRGGPGPAPPARGFRERRHRRAGGGLGAGRGCCGVRAGVLGLGAGRGPGVPGSWWG